MINTKIMIDPDLILEGNKLIAKFMGAEVVGDTYCFHLGNPTFDIQIEQMEFEDAKKLRYHSSYEWLMSVIEKIANLDITPSPNYTGYRIEIVPNGYVKIEGFSMRTIFTNVSIEEGLMPALWKAIVKFIEYYNI